MKIFLKVFYIFFNFRKVMLELVLDERKKKIILRKRLQQQSSCKSKFQLSAKSKWNVCLSVFLRDIEATA